MFDGESLLIERLRDEHIGALAPIMRGAFDADSRMHRGKPGGPEGYEDGSFLKKWGLEGGSVSYATYLGARLAGATILWIGDNGENFLGCFFLDAELEGKGLGTKLWRLIESLYPETRIWRTETANYSLRNHYFYVVKCGFSIVGMDRPDESGFANYRMEKRMSI
jgi:hypothetical protein